MANTAKTSDRANDIWIIIAILFGIVIIYGIINNGIPKDDRDCEEAYVNGQYFEQCHDFKEEEDWVNKQIDEYEDWERRQY